MKLRSGVAVLVRAPRARRCLSSQADPLGGDISGLPKEVGLAGFKGDNLPLHGLLERSGGTRYPAPGALGGVRIAAARI